MLPLYFDTAATTFVDPDVIADMLDVLQSSDANPSSSHLFGQRAAALVNAARDTIATELGCDADEVIFTAGATEANNLALSGIALAHHDQGVHIVTSAIEPSHALRAMGIEGDPLYGAVRISFSRDHTEADIDAAADCILRAVERIRELH